MTSAEWDSKAAKVIQREREILTCCYCYAPLEPIELDTHPTTGEQTLSWTCRNTRKGKCVFPAGMPVDVFCLKRTAAETEQGVIPKPNLRRLPRKYRVLYPSTFSDESDIDGSTTRPELSISPCENYSLVNPLQTVASNAAITCGVEAATNRSKMSDESRLRPSSTCHEIDASVWSSCKLKEITWSHIGLETVPSVSMPQSTGDPSPRDDLSSDSRNSPFSTSACERDVQGTSSGTSSTTTWSSIEARDEGSLAEFICDQLQYTGVDVARLEDEELVKRMAGVVKKLHKEKPRCRFPGYLTSAEYRASVDYLFNLDVGPIKRRLNVMSTELTRAMAVMRSDCNIDTMLDAMGGSTPMAAPPLKRTRFMYSKVECRKRVEAILKSLSKRKDENRSGENFSVEALCIDDQSGAEKWYEGEDGPSTSDLLVPEQRDSTKAEEERLNDIVQKKVRTHIANSVARRLAHRRKKIEQSVTVDPSLVPRFDVDISSDRYNGSNSLFSFDSPYAEGLYDDSSIGFCHDFVQNSGAYALVDQTNLISDTSSVCNTSVSLTPDNPASDDEFQVLFGDLDMLN